MNRRDLIVAMTATAGVSVENLDLDSLTSNGGSWAGLSRWSLGDDYVDSVTAIRITEDGLNQDTLTSDSYVETESVDGGWEFVGSVYTKAGVDSFPEDEDVRFVFSKGYPVEKWTVVSLDNV